MDSENNKKQPGGLNRRDLLKVITAAPAAALVPLTPGLASELAGAPVPDAAQESQGSYEPKFFSAHQYKTIAVLSDWIIPADERSGSATQAGVPEFMDDWLDAERTAASTHRHGRATEPTMGTEVLGSLTWMDMECNRIYSHDFVDCSNEQQKQILDRIAYPKKAAPDDVNAAAAFSQVRDLVLAGFFSSKMGVEDLPYLGNKVVEQWNGCPQADLERLGVSYNEDWKDWKKAVTDGN
jgi:gluconate 2-dehydrogenase gamma chain